jgi:anaerobic selenocysteine-containing dehydrogenase
MGAQTAQTTGTIASPTLRHGICRFCHAMCSMKVTLEDGRITHLIGDKDNPVYRGYSCVKGRNFHEFHYSPERVTRPLKRQNDGSFAITTLDSALGEISRKVQEIIAAHGPRAVAMYTGTFSHFCPAGVMTRQAFMDAIGSPMRFTNGSIDQPGKPIAMALHGRWGAGPQLFEKSDVCLVVGANPLVSMWGGITPFNPAKRLHDAQQCGLQLIVIDPRRSETARKAELHLQCLPGFDAAILAAMIRCIIREGLVDAEFIAAEAEGLELLTKAVEPFEPERVEKAAGLQPGQIEAAARMFARTADGQPRRGIATGGTGSNMAPHGTLMEYLLLCLNTICGRWLRAGEHMSNKGVLYRMYPGHARAEKPRPGFGFGEQLRVRGLSDTAAGLPTAALADEILTPGDGQVKALFVVGGNPLANWPNRAKVQRALDSLQLLVCIDPQMSATAQGADYVIGPMFGYEMPATSFASEGITYYGLSLGIPEPFAQYQPALIDPPADSEVIEDWRFFYELARRMDLSLGYFGHSFDMQTPPTTDELLETFLARSPVPLSEVKQHPGGSLFPQQGGPAQARADDWPFRLQLAQPDMLRELAVAFDDLQHAGNSGAAPNIPGTLDLKLVSRREHAVYNSVGHRLPALQRRRPYNPVYLHPDDAAALGVTDGDRLSITTAQGEVFGQAELADDLRPGVISVAHGFPNQRGLSKDSPGQNPGTSVSALLDDETRYDPISGLPLMSAVPVRVSRAQ